MVFKGWVTFWCEKTKTEGTPCVRKKKARNSLGGRGFKTEIGLGVKDVAKAKETRMCNTMRQGRIKQTISLIQSNIGDFQVREWKTIDRFIYSSQLVFTVVIVSPKLSLKFYNENNAWKRDAGRLLGFAVLSTSSATWDKLLCSADSICSLNWV